MLNVYLEVTDSCGDLRIFADVVDVILDQAYSVELLDVVEEVELGRGEGGDGAW